ncbi:MAG: amidohydrolase [Spirosomaceae bacterium]|jgi:predicted amidohydrolase|nr:amidohydrolase [Spirosomataceae bacterium]
MNLKVSVVQTDIYWENSTANLASLEEKIAQIDQTDLIILPEMFTTGFTMNAAQVAEPMNFMTHRWMKQMAAQAGAVVVGSVIIKEREQFFNRLLWVEPSGKTDFYDKRHLFRMVKENDVFSGGNKKLIKEWKGWRICPLICYDLRFPVWSRNKNLEYDLLLYVASWPEKRIQVWDKLLMARAIENQSYVIGVNRIGTDDLGINYVGHSAVIEYSGNPVYEAKNQEIIYTATLDKEKLHEFRQKFPSYLDADDFTIH